jgi:hypothetical protein
MGAKILVATAAAIAQADFGGKPPCVGRIEENFPLYCSKIKDGDE